MNLRGIFLWIVFFKVTEWNQLTRKFEIANVIQHQQVLELGVCYQTEWVMAPIFDNSTVYVKNLLLFIFWYCSLYMVFPCTRIFHSVYKLMEVFVLKQLFFPMSNILLFFGVGIYMYFSQKNLPLPPWRWKVLLWILQLAIYSLILLQSHSNQFCVKKLTLGKFEAIVVEFPFCGNWTWTQHLHACCAV